MVWAYAGVEETFRFLRHQNAIGTGAGVCMGGRAESAAAVDGDPEGWIRDVSDERLVRYVKMMKDRRNWGVRVTGEARNDPYYFMNLLDAEIERRVGMQGNDSLERMIFGSIRNL